MKKGLSASTLKWIAICSMLIDHFAIAIYWQMPAKTYEIYEVLRYIGRVAFPIYCFLLVEGFFYTKNIKKYIGRCLLFAFLSEIPFDMAIYGKLFFRGGQNVYFTLTLGLCTLWVLHKIKGNTARDMVYRVVCIAVGAGIAQVLNFDYHFMGILAIIMFYYCRKMLLWQKTLVGAVFFSYEVTAPLAFLPIHYYNGNPRLPL